MRFKELPRKWKAVIVLLAALTASFAVFCITFEVFWTQYQHVCAEARVQLRKADGQLLGERIEIPREGKPSVKANIYFPKSARNSDLPLVVNVHGGGFVGGDADVLDTQSARLADECNAIVLTVNYTKADVEPTSYGAQEIEDAVFYFARNADQYHVDAARVFIIGYSAGAYYAEESEELLQQNGFQLAGLILCYPWTTGLSASALDGAHCPTLFVLAGQDPISQNARPYIESMRAAGIALDIEEFDRAVRSFIESNNPEGKTGATTDMSNVINPEQEQLAREAEARIADWIKAC